MTGRPRAAIEAPRSAAADAAGREPAAVSAAGPLHIVAPGPDGHLAASRPSACWSTRSGQPARRRRRGWWTALFAAVRPHARQLRARPRPERHRPTRSSTACSSRSRRRSSRSSSRRSPRTRSRGWTSRAGTSCSSSSSGCSSCRSRRPSSRSCSLFADGFGIDRDRSSRSGWPTRATACRSRSTCSATSWAALPREVFESAAIDGASPVDGVLPAGAPDERAGARGARRSSSSCSSGTTCSWR